MKKYFEVVPGLDNLKSKMVVVREEDESKKTIYIVLAVIATILAMSAVAVVFLLKNKANDEFADEFDYDWDDLDDELYEDLDDCCCNDDDVDNSIKIEEI